MRHMYCESFDKKDIEDIFLKCKPDIYKSYIQYDLRTLNITYCMDMWFAETDLERDTYE